MDHDFIPEKGDELSINLNVVPLKNMKNERFNQLKYR